jgi:pimeloyl-ACP methyl ester carboxylesterase
MDSGYRTVPGWRLWTGKLAFVAAMPLTTRHLTSGVLLAAPLLLAGCDRGRSITAPASPAAEVAAEAPASAWASIVDGEDAGALYRLMMPASWNGDLVVLAHGYVDPLTPVVLPDFAAFSDSLGRRGFAVAFSSYSENGSVVKDGAQKTHALTEIFAGQFTAPQRVFVGGQSMGGLIALDLAEGFPTQYAGIYSFCGVTGGTTLHHRYIMDVRALFDVFYRKPDPNDPARTVPVLPGDVLHVDRDGLDLETGVRLVARNAMLANDAGARIITQISQTPVPFAAGNRNQMINSIADALFRHAREIDDLMARGHDASAIDNTGVVYTGAGIDHATLDFVNANVQRFESSKFAAHEAAQYYDPDGSLRMPFVSLRSARDPALPALLNDDTYLAKLTQEQRDRFVEVRVVNTFGHCNATIQDVVNGFDALVTRANALGGA